jgi:hypothetical protein
LAAATPITPTEIAEVSKPDIKPEPIQEIVTQLEPVIHTTTTVISSTNNQVAAASSVIKQGTSSVGNMSMAESMEGSFYGGYDNNKHVDLHEADNIPVESRPKTAG